MKLYEYLSRDEQLQYQIVWELGTHLETLNQKGEAYLLYALGDFFVEIRYCRRTNQILGKNQFKDSEALDKYLPGEITL